MKREREKKRHTPLAIATFSYFKTLAISFVYKSCESYNPPVNISSIGEYSFPLLILIPRSGHFSYTGI